MFDANVHVTLFILHLLQSLFPGINYLQFSHPELSLAIKNVLESENCTLLPEQVSASDLSVKNLSDTRRTKKKSDDKRYILYTFVVGVAAVSAKRFLALSGIFGGERRHSTQLNRSKTI